MKTENKNSQSSRVRVYRGYNNFQLRVSDMERVDSNSETIEDDSYTVREIMEKFTIHGETFAERKTQALYQDEATHDSLDLRQVQSMDLVDKDELYSSVLNRQAEASRKLQDLREKFDAENAEKVAREKEAYNDEQDAKQAKRSEKYGEKEKASKNASNEAQ